MEDLSRMFGFTSPGPSLPWLWIIEYLSSFGEIDTSIIHGLIEAAPVSEDALGENTTERVALRCLEDLFGPNNGFEDAVPPDSRVVFDHSESCNDVLKQILQEVSVSELKKGGPKLLKWDILPFIKHKRTSLPKCALEQLKGSRKEIPIIIIDDENGDGEGNLVPPNYESDNGLLQDGLIRSKRSRKVRSKRSRNDMVAGNLEGLISDNLDGVFNRDDLQLKDKKFEQDASCTNQSVGPIQVPLHGNEQLQKDSQVDDVDKDERVTSRTLGQNDDVADVELLDNQIENAENADTVGEQIYGDRPSQNVLVVEPNHVENDQLEKGHASGCTSQNVDQVFPRSFPNSASADVYKQNIASREANDDKEHPCIEQCEDEDELFDPVLKKWVFLSSQCTASRDLLVKAGRTEQNFCVKCNGSGPLLVCSSSACPVAVHESCLGSPAHFDDKGDFHCAYCVYSTAISEYLEAKEEALSAGKELPAFMELLSNVNIENRTKQIKLQVLARLNGK